MLLILEYPTSLLSKITRCPSLLLVCPIEIYLLPFILNGSEMDHGITTVRVQVPKDKTDKDKNETIYLIPK